MEHLHLYLDDQFRAGANKIEITEENGETTFSRFFVQPVFKDGVTRERREVRLLYQKDGRPWVF